MFITTAQVALAAPMLAIGGTLLGGWIQSRREERRVASERAMEKLRWEREDARDKVRSNREGELEFQKARQDLLVRWADARREAYAAFLNSTRVWKDELYKAHDDLYIEKRSGLDYREHAQVASAALADLELLANDLTRKEATAVLDDLRHGSIVHEMCIHFETTGSHDKHLAVREQVLEFLNKAVKSRERFLHHAQLEIGTSDVMEGPLSSRRLLKKGKSDTLPTGPDPTTE